MQWYCWEELYAVVNPNNKVSGVKIWYNQIYIERTRTNINTKIKRTKSGKIIFDFTQKRYDIDELSINPQFTSLHSDCQRRCIEKYRSVSPYLIESVLMNTDPFIDCSGIKFIEDTTKVSRGIIDVLYLLRCSLMHGDIETNALAMDVYKYAYYILTAVLKKLV